MKRKTIFAGGLTVLAIAAVPAGSAPAWAQPQVALEAAPAKAETSRVLLLQGGQNFRDLGGYQTLDGRAVRWRMLFRSGAMDRLTPADFDYLHKLHLRTVIDFRSTDERHAAPVHWPADGAPHVIARDYPASTLGLDPAAIAKMSGDEARVLMAGTYSSILDSFNDQYRGMFDELLASHTPLAFNCSAGKDRTGVAAALILTALNVPRETIIEDYLLSNQYFRPQLSTAANLPSADMWRQLPPDVVKAFMGVDRSYIEAVFRVIDAHPGGAEGYLRDRLGLDRAALTALRNRYTIPG